MSVTYSYDHGKRTSNIMDAFVRHLNRYIVHMHFPYNGANRPFYSCVLGDLAFERQ